MSKSGPEVSVRSLVRPGRNVGTSAKQQFIGLLTARLKNHNVERTLPIAFKVRRQVDQYLIIHRLDEIFLDNNLFLVAEPCKKSSEKTIEFDPKSENTSSISERIEQKPAKTDQNHPEKRPFFRTDP